MSVSIAATLVRNINVSELVVYLQQYTDFCHSPERSIKQIISFTVLEQEIFNRDLTDRS